MEQLVLYEGEDNSPQHVDGCRSWFLGNSLLRFGSPKTLGSIVPQIHWICCQVLPPDVARELAKAAGPDFLTLDLEALNLPPLDPKEEPKSQSLWFWCYQFLRRLFWGESCFVQRLFIFFDESEVSGLKLWSISREPWGWNWILQQLDNEKNKNQEEGSDDDCAAVISSKHVQ